VEFSFRPVQNLEEIAARLNVEDGMGMPEFGPGEAKIVSRTYSRLVFNRQRGSIRKRKRSKKSKTGIGSEECHTKTLPL
jgi:hypothetical protein